MCTCHELEQASFFDQLAECFGDDTTAASVVGRLDVAGRLKSFASTTPAEYWRYVGRQLEHGLIEDGVPRLVNTAAELMPGNKVFKAALAQCTRLTVPHRDPLDATRQGAAIELKISADLPMDQILHIIAAVVAAGKEAGQSCSVLVTHGSTILHAWLEGLPADQQAAAVRRIEAELDRRAAELRLERDPDGRVATVTPRPYRHPDSFFDPIQLQGPDGSIYEATEIRAGTLIKDVIRMALGDYTDADWPRTPQGTRRNAVLDLVGEDGSHRRLDPTMTLFEAGVRPGDTLRFSPESTAGVDPLMRDAALRRVRRQIDEVLHEQPGMHIEANGLTTPTEYVLRFEAASFGPPPSGGTSPQPISEHAVYLFLPPEFPIKAPQVFWQTPLFHPNVHPESGAVCLGELADKYQPGLDVRRLVQMLVDIARFRNYSVAEGYYDEAAARWAVGIEGQTAIARIGGRSLLRDLARPATGAGFKLRKVVR